MEVFTYRSLLSVCFPQMGAVWALGMCLSHLVLFHGSNMVSRERNSREGAFILGFESNLWLILRSDEWSCCAFIFCQICSLRLFIHVQQTSFQMESKTCLCNKWQQNRLHLFKTWCWKTICCKADFGCTSKPLSIFLKILYSHLSAILTHVSLTSHHRSDVVI